jgi:hypothetical protein
MSPLIGSAYIGIEGLDASTAESAEHTDRSRSPDDPYGSTPVYECRDQSRFDGSVPVKFPQAMVTFPDMAVRILECSYRETTQLLETQRVAGFSRTHGQAPCHEASRKRKWFLWLYWKHHESLRGLERSAFSARDISGSVLRFPPSLPT